MDVRAALPWIFVLLAPALWASCASPSPPTGDAYDQRFVGPWRITLEQGRQTFSDYVFSAGGRLTHLLSVADGQAVTPMQGATTLRCPDAAGPACTFGNAWHSFDADTLIVGGQCDDGTPREIELGFSDETRAAQVSVRSVAGAINWSQPVWRFEKCDQKACGG